MPTDRQKVCKCGADVAEFLADIRILERNLKIAKVENSAIYIPAFKTKFDEKRSEIITDLDRITYGVVQKVKDCSK